MAFQVFVSPSEVVQGGGDGYCGTSMSNMDANFFSAAVCFSPSCGMRLDGVGFWRTSVGSDVVCVTKSSRERLGNFFCTGKSSIMSETRSDAVLGM